MTVDPAPWCAACAEPHRFGGPQCRRPRYDQPSADCATIDAYRDAAQQILAEATRARAKFPPFNSPHEGWAVLREEVDEMWDEVKANNLELALAEALQVGAMAVRFIADLHQRAEK